MTVYAFILALAPDAPSAAAPARALESPLLGYVPILLCLVAAIALPVALLLVSKMLHRKVYEPNKMSPYECGVEPVRGARDRFSVRYYLVAMLFLIFEVETVFLLPWAVIYNRLALLGLIEMLVFVGVLVVGYFYAWRKGAFEWA